MSSKKEKSVAIATQEILTQSAVRGLHISAPLHLLTFLIQENVYNRPNILHPISELLQRPTYLTSYFGVLNAICFVVFLETRVNNAHLMKFPLALPLLITLAATSHEVYQAYHARYVDTNTLDIIMTWLAFLSFTLLYKKFESSNDPCMSVENDEVS